MKKALIISLAAALMLPVGMSGALAQPAPRPHYYQGHGHHHRHYRAPRRTRRVRVTRYRRAYVPVYRPRRAPVVIVSPAPPPPPVYIVEPAPPRPRTIVRRSEPARVVPQAAKPHKRSLLGVNVRLSGASLEGERAGLSAAEDPTMGGVGIAFKARFGGSLGLELSLDALTNPGDDVTQTTVPAMASLTYHLFPTSRIQPYGLVGAGVHFSRLSYLDGRYVYDMTELAGQLGAGVEVFLTKNLSISADFRAQTVLRSLDTQAKIRTDCLNQVDGLTGFCDNIHSANPDDKVNVGVQFQAGATWYF